MAILYWCNLTKLSLYFATTATAGDNDDKYNSRHYYAIEYHSILNKKTNAFSEKIKNQKRNYHVFEETYDQKLNTFKKEIDTILSMIDNHFSGS